MLAAASYLHARRQYDSTTTTRQQLVDHDLDRASNIRRFDYDYEVGGQVLVKVRNPNELDARYEGPYEILRIHANGYVVTIRRRNNTSERINIRHVKPYRGP